MDKTAKTGRCSTGACVDIKPIADGQTLFQFTSTVDGNNGFVNYTHEEVVVFFADVKAGNWDHLL